MSQRHAVDLSQMVFHDQSHPPVVKPVQAVLGHGHESAPGLMRTADSGIKVGKPVVNGPSDRFIVADSEMQIFNI